MTHTSNARFIGIITDGPLRIYKPEPQPQEEAKPEAAPQDQAQTPAGDGAGKEFKKAKPARKQGLFNLKAEKDWCFPAKRIKK